MLYIIAMDNLYYSELVDAFTALNSQYKEISDYHNTTTRAIVKLKILYRQVDTLVSSAADCYIHYTDAEDAELSSSFEKLQNEITAMRNNVEKQIITRLEAIKDIIYQ